MGGRGARLAAAAGLLATAVAWPVVLVALGHPFTTPHLLNLDQARHVLSSSDPQATGRAVAAVLSRVAWLAWAYLIVVFGLGALSRAFRHVDGAYRALTPAPLRNLVVTPVLALVISAAGRPGASPPAGHPPPAATAQAAPGGTSVPGQPISLPGGAPAGSGASGAATGAVAGSTSGPAPARTYQVRPGDSVWRIAERECGSPLMWRQIVDMNLGSAQPGGEVFSDPHWIRPGWSIRLPAACGPVTGAEYVVAPGESLSLIAAREYGDASMAAAIWEANRGRSMGDGRSFTSPNLVYPGWVLRLPTRTSTSAPTTTPHAATPAPGSSQAATPAPASTPSAAPTGRTSPPPPTPSRAVPSPAPAGGVVTPAPPLASPDPAPQGPVSSGAGDAAPGGSNPASHERGAESHRSRIPVSPAILPASFASLLAAGFALARIQRRRRWRPGEVPAAVPEGPIANEVAASGAAPSLDLLGAASARVLAAWSEAGGSVPRVLAAWEAPDAVRFLLLDEHPESALPASVERDGVEVGFHRRDGALWAETRADTGKALRRNLLVLADGLLVPVAGRTGEGPPPAGGSSRAALHLPVLGTPLWVSGPGAAGMVESILVAAGLRAGAEDLRIVAVGDVPPLLEEAAAPEALAFPAIERPSPSELEAVRTRLEKTLVLRAERLAQAEAEGIEEYAFHHADDRLAAEIYVLDAATAANGVWASLIAQGERLGIAALVLGEGGSRRIVVDDTSVVVEAEGLGDLTGLVPCVPGADALDEISAQAAPPPARTVPVPGIDAGADEPVDPHVRVFTLGGLRVERDGEVVAPPNRTKARELLAFLAAYGPATDERIADALGPEATPDNLKQWRHAARNWLRGETNRIVLEWDRTTKQYRLASESVWVDLVVFEASLRRAAHAEDPEPRLRRAVEELYAGEFCQDEDWEWAEPTRTRLRFSFIDACERLATIAEQRGDLPGARQQLQRGLQADFYPEVLQRRLMQLRASLGEWDELAAGFRRLEHRLSTEHDAQPEAETYDLFRRLMAQRPKPRRAAAERRLQAAPTPPAGVPDAGVQDLPSADAGRGR